MTLTKKDAVEVLKQIQDPELAIDVYTLGLIREIKIKKKDIKVTMTFTSPTCPYAPQLVASIKAGLKTRGFTEPEMEFTFNPPWEPSEEVKMMLGLA
jgi:metal-sulfur cluster biosynthetic enzyme|tara:strand:+ start:518 stop:808 length:291 start_codon:yes stop_codon:yes gene_type:complete